MGANQRLRRAIMDENGGGTGVGAMRAMHKAAARHSIFVADARNFWVPGIGPMCEVLAVCVSFGDGSGTATFCFMAETWGMVFRGAALPKASARAVKFPIHGPGRIDRHLMERRVDRRADHIDTAREFLNDSGVGRSPLGVGVDNVDYFH